MGNLPFFPTEASTIASQTDLLTLTLILISGFFTVIVMALIVYFSLKYHKGRPADRSNPPVNQTKVELGWIGGLTFLSLGVFAWATVLFFRIHRPPENTLDIYVVGKQWMWKIQHQEGPSEINTLHVPLGQPVRLIMTSQDVIHSFYVPAFRLKQDVIPGRYTTLWFQATQTGEFHLFCAEYCGTNHAEMRGTVIVMEPHEYQQWLSGGATAGQTLAGAGEQLFSQLGCASCHAPGPGTVGPSLEGLFGSTVQLSDGSSVTADENYLRESIFLPNARLVAGYDAIMPTFEGRITEEQAIQLIAYLKSLGSNQ